MNFTQEVLLQYGAEIRQFQKGDVIFSEGRQAYYYFQIITGFVQMVNQGGENDFVQGIFYDGESFGEPPLLGEFPYPAMAIAFNDVTLLMLVRRHFIELLRDHFDMHLALTANLCHRIEFKTRQLRELNFDSPEERILHMIDYLKKKLPRNRFEDQGYFVVPFTRQELANLTGLRVETVIRKVGKLEEDGKLIIKNRKIYRAY